MINFLTEDYNFNYRGKLVARNWIKHVVDFFSKGDCSAGEINIVFCSDNYILSVNNEFLKHNYYTDIITFNYNSNNVISGDLLISIPTVLANSSEYGSTMYQELNRVLIHGILHLLGYDDATVSDKAIMREKEDQALIMLQKLHNE